MSYTCGEFFANLRSNLRAVDPKKPGNAVRVNRIERYLQISDEMHPQEKQMEVDLFMVLNKRMPFFGPVSYAELRLVSLELMTQNYQRLDESIQIVCAGKRLQPQTQPAQTTADGRQTGAAPSGD